MKHFIKKNITTLLILSFFTSIALSADIIDLRPQLSPVRSQGARNTCNAFEAVVLAEFLIESATGTKVRLSENYSYWAGKNLALTTNYLKEAYLHVDGLAGFLGVEGMKDGSMLESSWPYVSTNGFLSKTPGCEASPTIPSECFTGTPPATAAVIPYKFKTIFIARENIAADLAQNKRPILMNINWYYKSVDILGNVHMPSDADLTECEVNGNQKTCGGHVILIVGHDPAKKSFIFRSSWGPTWGTNGYGTIPEELVIKHCEMCRYINRTDLSAEDAEMIFKSTQGVTAELISIPKN